MYYPQLLDCSRMAWWLKHV